MKSLNNILDENEKKNIGEGIVKIIDEFGLGTLSKSDLEARIYSLLRQNISPSEVKDSRDWIRLLRVTPSKLRSMQLIESVKQRPIDLNDKEQWKEVAAAIQIKKLEVSDKSIGLVQFYLDDAHLKRFVEEFVIESGSSLDYKENRGQIVLKYSIYLAFIFRMAEILDLQEEDIFKNISEDKDFQKIEQEYNKPKALWDELKTKFKDKAIDEIAGNVIEMASTALIKVAKKKLLG